MFKVNDLCRRKYHTTKRIIKYISSETVVAACPLTNKESIYERKVFEDTFELNPIETTVFVYSIRYKDGSYSSRTFRDITSAEVARKNSTNLLDDAMISQIKKVTISF